MTDVPGTILAADDNEEEPERGCLFLPGSLRRFLRGDIAILFTVISLAIGGVALFLTPREEEPQIVVPMADVMIEAPGLSAEEVERQVTQPLEKLLYQIDGVEYVYSMSQNGRAVVTVRFFVGEDREDSLVKLYNKVDSNADQIPASVTSWVVKPIEIDDVPIVIVTLWSDDIHRYGDHELHRIAQEMQNELQAIPDTNRVWVTGGRPREIRVELDTQRMASRSTSPLQVARALQQSNIHVRAGGFDQQNQSFIVEAGTNFRDVRELENLVVQVVSDRPVYLRDVADIIDGPAEPEGYSWIGFGPAERGGRAANRIGFAGLYPAVHIAVAKRKGSNAVAVAHKVEPNWSNCRRSMLPARRSLPDHARLWRNRQRQSQRAGRRTGDRRHHGRRFDRVDDWLAGRVGRRAGDSGLLQPDAGSQSDAGLHDQPRHDVRPDSVTGLAGGRSDHGRRKHCQVFFHAKSLGTEKCVGRDPGSSSGVDHVDVGHHRQFSAAFVYHRA